MIRIMLIALAFTACGHAAELQFEERTKSPKLFRLMRLTSLGKLDPVVDRLQYSVALIRVPDAKGASEGSGVYIGEGFVLTAEHVIEDGNGSVTIDLGGELIPGRVVAVGEADQALIQLSRPTRAPAVALASTEVRNDETVIAAGYGIGPLRFWINRPGGFSADGYAPGRTVHREYLSPPGGRGSIPGDSGGPVFNDRGQLLSNLWGGNGNNTFAVTNTETRRFIQRSAGRFPVLERILGGGRGNPGVDSRGFCRQGSQACGIGDQQCDQGNSGFAPRGSFANPGSRSIVPDTLPPQPQYAGPTGPASQQPMQLSPPANARQPPVELQYVAPREDQLVEIMQRMRDENPELFKGDRGEPGPAGVAGPAGRDGSDGRPGRDGIDGVSPQVDVSQFATTNQIGQLQDETRSRFETVFGQLGNIAQMRASRIESGSGLAETYGPALISALGISGPIGVGLAALGWFMRRRRGGGDDRSPFPLTSLPAIQQQQPMIAAPVQMPVLMQPQAVQSAPQPITLQPPQQAPQPRLIPRKKTRRYKTITETTHEPEVAAAA